METLPRGGSVVNFASRHDGCATSGKYDEFASGVPTGEVPCESSADDEWLRSSGDGFQGERRSGPADDETERGAVDEAEPRPSSRALRARLVRLSIDGSNGEVPSEALRLPSFPRCEDASDSRIWSMSDCWVPLATLLGDSVPPFGEPDGSCGATLCSVFVVCDESAERRTGRVGTAGSLKTR